MATIALHKSVHTYFKYIRYLIFHTHLVSLLMKKTKLLLSRELLEKSIYILQRTSLQKQSSTMELSFQNNASISLLTIFDKPEPPDPDDFWAEMYDRPVVKYGLTLFTISTLVLLTPYLYISLMFIHDKHFK